MVLRLPETKEHLTAMSLHSHYGIVMSIILSQVFLLSCAMEGQWLSREEHGQ